MIKPFIICMSGLVMSLMCMATPTIQKNGDFIPIAIEEPVNPSQGHPHAPARRLFDAYVDTELSAVIITASSDLGEVDAYIENMSTGDYCAYVLQSSSTTILPVSISAGTWQITLSLESGEYFYGEFEI